MKKSYIRNLSFGLLVTVVLAFIGCSNPADDPPEPTKYRVTFDSQGGSDVSAQPVTEGQKATKPANPSKQNHTFAGWFKEATTENRWNFDTSITADITLYAKWVEGENVILYTLTFDSDGGSAIVPITMIADGETIQLATYKSEKANNKFKGWYVSTDASKTVVPNVTVTGSITLKALWAETVTVTFNTNGGSAIDAVKVGKGDTISLGNYNPTKTGNIFGGWYTDAALTTSAEGQGGRIIVTGNTTLYAKWTDASALADYTGVWTSDNETYLLNNDGTGWRFYSNSNIELFTWNTTRINSFRWTGSAYEYPTLTLSHDKQTLSVTVSSKEDFTKQTATQTPAGSNAVTGTWRSHNDISLELKADGSAVVSRYSNTVTLGYRVEDSKLYLVQKDTDLVVMIIALDNNKPEGFSKVVPDNRLYGIWEIEHNGTKAAYEFKANGEGTYYLFGAKVSFTYVVTENAVIINENYYGCTVSDSSLTVGSATYTKVNAAPSGSGAGGYSRLHGTWKAGQESLTFNSDGTVSHQVPGMTNTYIWQAAEGEVNIYFVSFGNNLGSYSIPYEYTISGSTLTFVGMEWTKQ